MFDFLKELQKKMVTFFRLSFLETGPFPPLHSGLASRVGPRGGGRGSKRTVLVSLDGNKVRDFGSKHMCFSIFSNENGNKVSDFK